MYCRRGQEAHNVVLTLVFICSCDFGQVLHIFTLKYFDAVKQWSWT